MLDKAHLSPDDKAKAKALLDLQNAIQKTEDLTKDHIQWQKRILAGKERKRSLKMEQKKL